MSLTSYQTAPPRVGKVLVVLVRSVIAFGVFKLLYIEGLAATYSPTP